ncbi:hypothetical protein ABFP33_20425 [Acinetobacter bereziniae]|uniref:hypothetical protein n=1 Tax=Acinetobacter bereziniae TaxID=106648 RepID=UPI003215DC90
MNNIDFILNDLNLLLENNVLGDIAYGNRCKGFIGELDFLNWMSVYHPTNQLYSGGYFIPKESIETSLKDTVYITISKDNPDNYLEIYQLIW